MSKNGGVGGMWIAKKGGRGRKSAENIDIFLKRG